jgi:hypothetical protein
MTAAIIDASLIEWYGFRTPEVKHFEINQDKIFNLPVKKRQLRARNEDDNAWPWKDFPYNGRTLPTHPTRSSLPFAALYTSKELFHFPANQFPFIC